MPTPKVCSRMRSTISSRGGLTSDVCAEPWCCVSVQRLPTKSGKSIRGIPGPSCSWSRPAELTHTREPTRSEEHTSELQSQSNLVCRLLLEKKKKKKRL